MKMEIVINSGHIQLMVQFMQSRQIGLSEVFSPEQLALIADISSRGSTVVPCVQFAAMLRQLEHYLQEPDVILQIASMVSTSHLGIVGYLLHACDNLGEALGSLRRYRKLIVTAIEEIQVVSLGEDIKLQWSHVLADDYVVLELGVAIMYEFARQLVDQPLTLNAVKFVRSASTEVQQRYQQFFGCPVYFEQPQTCVIFPAKTLSVAIRQPDRQLLDILQQQADQALLALPQQDEFVQQVHRHLIELCHAGEPHVQGLAERMLLSVRTVQRRLAENQLTFQQALDEVRQQLCLQYLEQQIQLSDIAQLLGYSDQSAFTRAYKRWTGSTPHQQRMASRQKLSVGH